MKDYHDAHFRAGYQYESAQSLYNKWLGAIQKAYKTFELISVTKSNERESWQEISVSYSIDSVEVEKLDLAEKLIEANKEIEYYRELLDKLLDEAYYKTWKEAETFYKNAISEQGESK